MRLILFGHCRLFLRLSFFGAALLFRGGSLDLFLSFFRFLRFFKGFCLLFFALIRRLFEFQRRLYDIIYGAQKVNSKIMSVK